MKEFLSAFLQSSTLPFLWVVIFCRHASSLKGTVSPDIRAFSRFGLIEIELMALKLVRGFFY
jgi:hypothetical protein